MENCTYTTAFNHFFNTYNPTTAIASGIPYKPLMIMMAHITLSPNRNLSIRKPLAIACNSQLLCIIVTYYSPRILQYFFIEPLFLHIQRHEKDEKIDFPDKK